LGKEKAMAGCFPSPALPGSGSTGLLLPQNSQPSGSPHTEKGYSQAIRNVKPLRTAAQSAVDFLCTRNFFRNTSRFEIYIRLHYNRLQ
jgi:hypothetical protein